MSDENWNNDSIQFPRLIDELEAAGAFTKQVYEDLSASMDLSKREISELISRAQNEWERIKKQWLEDKKEAEQLEADLKMNSKRRAQKFKKSIQDWKPSPSDQKEMREVYAQDRKDLMKVYKAYVKGDWEKAADEASDLDTVVRDVIPAVIYDEIMEK